MTPQELENQKALSVVLSSIFELDDEAKIDEIRNGKISPISAAPEYLDPETYKEGRFKLLGIGNVEKSDFITKQVIIDGDGNVETVEAALLLCVERKGVPCNTVVKAMQTALVAKLKEYVPINSNVYLEYRGDKKSSSNGSFKFQDWDIRIIK